MTLLPATGPTGTWTYWRPSGSGIVELGTVRGLEVALPVHFHAEDQMTFVLSGRRRFVIGGERFDLAPGQGVHIPAGTPHRSLSEPFEVVCINLYAPAGAYAAGDLLPSLGRHWRRMGRLDWPDLRAIAEGHRCLAGTPAGLIADPAASPAERPEDDAAWETVGAAARRAGLTREGFSRRFRREHGLPPHAFWLLGRLNDARRLLRAGEPIAAVAAETGFSDQSHLGRCFRRAFGVTPGRYRER